MRAGSVGGRAAASRIRDMRASPGLGGRPPGGGDVPMVAREAHKVLRAAGPKSSGQWGLLTVGPPGSGASGYWGLGSRLAPPPPSGRKGLPQRCRTPSVDVWAPQGCGTADTQTLASCGAAVCA